MLVQDQSRYTTYDLSDALLEGNLAQSIKIFQYLIAAGEPESLILWTLSMRLLMQLFEQPHNALQLGIWKTKVGLYQQALRRLNPQQFLGWSTLLLQVDAAIKGMSNENAQHLMQQAIAELWGKHYLYNNSAESFFFIPEIS